MDTPQSLGHERRDELLSTLADRYCRFVLSYFRNTSEESASVDDLATAVTRHDPVDENRAAKQLHHSALPELEDTGIVEFDVRTNTVRYHGDPHLENWHEHISDGEFEIMGERKGGMNHGEI